MPGVVCTLAIPVLGRRRQADLWRLVVSLMGELPGMKDSASENKVDGA